MQPKIGQEGVVRNDKTCTDHCTNHGIGHRTNLRNDHRTNHGIDHHTDHRTGHGTNLRNDPDDTNPGAEARVDGLGTCADQAGVPGAGECGRVDAVTADACVHGKAAAGGVASRGLRRLLGHTSRPCF
eukprot:365222-Chlamydomonas_euryale.AAC.7